MWCLRASSSASPGSVWGVRAPADIHGGIGRLWWDGSVQQIVRVMQHLSSIYQEISGRALKLSALVICFSPPADILCKHAKQKLPLVQEGLNLLSRGVGAIRSNAHHCWELVHDGELPLQTSPPPRCCGSALRQNRVSPSSCAKSLHHRRMFPNTPNHIVLLRAGCFGTGIR